MKVIVDGLDLETERHVEEYKSWNNKWIRVEDELPEVCLEVLCFAINDRNLKEIVSGHRIEDEWFHGCRWEEYPIARESGVRRGSTKVTHWMALPPYPEE